MITHRPDVDIADVDIADRDPAIVSAAAGVPFGPGGHTGDRKKDRGRTQRAQRHE
jgi:hypothetical protein